MTKDTYEAGNRSFKGPFNQYLSFLYRREGLTRDARELLMFYMEMCNGTGRPCKVSKAKISKFTEIGKDYIKPAREVLEEFGYITIHSGGNRSTYVVSVNMELLWDENLTWWKYHRPQECFGDKTFNPSKIEDRESQLAKKLAELEAREKAVLERENALKAIENFSNSGENLDDISSNLDDKSSNLDDISPNLDDISTQVRKKESKPESSVHFSGEKSHGGRITNSPLTGHVGFMGHISPPAEDNTDEDIVVELPALLHRINSLLGNRSKIKVDDKSWTKLCVEPFTYTNVGGQPQTMDTPADLWDTSSDWRSWAEKTIQYASKFEANGASARNKIVNMLSSGDRSPDGQKFTWVNYMTTVLNIADSTVKPASAPIEEINTAHIPTLESLLGED